MGPLSKVWAIVEKASNSPFKQAEVSLPKILTNSDQTVMSLGQAFNNVSYTRRVNALKQITVDPRKTKLKKKKKQLYGPFLLWMGFHCLKATATSRRQFTFYHSVPRNSWYSFYRPRKDERLSRPWSHPVILITGPLDWESSALTTRPLGNSPLKKKMRYLLKKHNFLG